MKCLSSVNFYPAWWQRLSSGLLLFFTILTMMLPLSLCYGYDGTESAIKSNGSSADRTFLTQEEADYLQRLGSIRVALIDNQPPLTMIEAGEAKGYLNELLIRITKDIGIEARFIRMSYAQSVQALREGGLDLLNDYSYSFDDSNALLRTQPVLSTPFVAVGGEHQPPVRSMTDLTGKKLVMVKEFQQTRNVQNRYPTYELVMVDSIDAAYRALRSKDADIYIDNATHAGFYLREHLLNDLRILGQIPQHELGKLSLYFAVNKQHPLLHSAISKSLQQLIVSKELAKLKSRWIQSYTNAPSIRLTSDEQAWLKQHHEVRVVLDPDWAPVEYRDSSGRYEGISLDYMSLIENILGIKLRIIDGLDWQEGVAAVKHKRADMFTSVARTPQRETYLKFTQPYLHIPIRIFGRDDVSYLGGLNNLAGKRIAIVKGYAIEDWLNNDYPDLELVPVETPLQGLRKVADGQVDVFIGNVATANYYVKKHGLVNVRELGDTPYSNSQSMAIRDDWPIFAGILQKALDTIPAAEHTKIFNRWMAIKFEQTIDYTILGWVLGAALIIIIAVVYWNRLLDRRVARHTRELADSEARFRNFFEKNSSVMMFVEPDSGEIIEANLSAIEYYGYTADELIGMSISDINTLPPGKLKRERLKARDEERNYFTFQHRLASGEVRDVEVYSTPISSTNRPLLFSIIHDITERKRAEERIAIQAHYDNLTGLPNRVLALDRLSMYQHESDRNGSRTGVMFIDLDDFKKINDTLGHDVGDMLLIEAGKRINSTVREADTVGRLGGDEFIVLIGHVSETGDLISVAEKILEKFQQPLLAQNRELVLTASIGISVYPDDGTDTHTLLRHADSAMYSAKEAGRSTYAFFTQAMNEKVSRRLSLEEQMRGALERDEFTLHYQPKLDLESGEIDGMEALLRWNNPTLGAVSPDEFIPVAEQTGQIVRIGEFVIREALDCITYCRQTYNENLSIAVNLSPRQFRDPGLVAYLESLIEQSGLPWEALELEITEGVLMTGLAYIDEAIATLSQHGIVLTMDDFGTGYSSLSYLRQFPFNVLKIDRSFINDITQDRHDLELVNATIAMAHNLGMLVVAEGVETEEQLSILRKHGCDLAQGYYFSKPVPPERLYEMFKHGITVSEN